MTSMIQHMPVWVCPICRSAFEPSVRENKLGSRADTGGTADCSEWGG